MKIYMMTDLEGVAGVVSFENQAYPDGKYFEDAKRLLTGEVNAAVEGLLEASVDEVVVCDGHGAGGIRYEELHPRVRLLHGRPLAPWAAVAAEVGDSDACMMIGQHAMAGTVDGNLNHTQSSQSIDYYKLNGKPIGEIAQFALLHGADDIPMIFLSGDDAACREAEDLAPGITTVSVKKGMSRGSAISLSMEEARKRIREGVAKAVRKHAESPIAPVKWPPPYVLEKRFFHTHSADGYATVPNAERVDSQTVRLHADDIRDIIYR